MSSVSDCELLVKQSDRLFSDRQPLLSLWQEMAENFYVERADFTTARNIGDDFASHLTTSAPLRANRELANIISTIFRPQDKRWFACSVFGYEKKSEDAKRWLQRASTSLYNAAYDEVSGFTRATKEADGDLATFGNAVISCEMNWNKRAFLVRNWHLRDVVWCENHDGTVGRIDRKWSPSAETLVQLFPKTVHEKIRKCLEKDRYRKFDVRHTFVESEMYMNGYTKSKKKYVSIFYDTENKTILEEIETNTPYYVVPRWKTISGSQYGFSPPAVSSLPDARLMQDMMLVLLEAGQKAVDPPMVAVMEAIRSDIGLYAGGITSVDADYDERLGEVLRPISRSNNAIPLGLDLFERINALIEDAHFMTKIGLPPLGGGMSPYEVSQRINDYIRNALPLLDPLEHEYNGGLCSLMFEVGMANGLFGPAQDIPPDLLGNEVHFKFINPLRGTEERAKGNMLNEAIGIISQAATLNQDAQYIIDIEAAAKDALDGIGAPRDWFRKDEEIAAIKAQVAEMQQLQQLAGMVQQGAEAAKGVGDAAQSLGQLREIMQFDESGNML